MKANIVEIAYANQESQYLAQLEVPENSTVRDVLNLSGILEKYPEIDLNHSHKLGIFGQHCDETLPVKAGDRVEIYRPLILDTITRRFDKVKKARKKQLLLKLQFQKSGK